MRNPSLNGIETAAASMKVGNELYWAVGLGVLLTVSAFFLPCSAPSDKQALSDIRLKKLAMAIDMYFIDTGEVPSELAQLLAADQVSWDGPYARGEDLIDPWGDPIRYQAAPGTAPGYRLACVCQGQALSQSAGQDPTAHPGTEDEAH